MFTSDLPRFPSTTGEFAPLFRLLDDYASHQLSRTGDGTTATASATSPLSAFKPKFDVKETKDSYELHGELPGIDQKDVQIEFSDPTTLIIKGRTERYSESSSSPSSAVLESAPEQGKLTATADPDTASSVAPSESHEHEHYHKPTVEDDEAGATTTATSTAGGEVTPSTSTTIATTDASQVQQQQQQKAPDHHYWVSERSIGSFHRSFSFPARIDQDRVKASLKHGILSVVVPKSQAPTARRINIE